MQTEEMGREKQINFRVTEEEAARFDAVASHLGLSLSSMIRFLVKREHAELEAAREVRAAGEGFKWCDEHEEILLLLKKSRNPMTRDEITEEVCRTRSGVNFVRTLNDLFRNGYAKRLKSGYAITDRGIARLEKR